MQTGPIDQRQWMMMQQQVTPQHDHYAYGAPQQQEQYVHGTQPEHYALAAHQQQQQEHYVHGPTHYQIPQTFEEVRTLWVGDLQYWMEENYLCSCFAVTGEQILSAKVIRNKQTLCSEGYGFVEFSSHTAAERVLQTYSGTLMPQTEQAFRLNWASFGVGEKRIEGGSDHSIFVGDLAVDVTDYVLQEAFRSRYPSVRGAKVIIDPITNRSKGYGFVRFGDENERTRAMSEMNGVFCSSRPMRISVATTKKGLPQQFPKTTSTTTTFQASPSQTATSDIDMNNSTIFVGGLDPMASEADLKQVFGQFGVLVYVKIPVGKGCGFVQFMHRSCAEEALQRIHGTVIGTQAVRLSWGRSPVKNQSLGWEAGQADPNQWNQGYYGYAQGYEGYGYTQDPSAYAYSTYPAYGIYPQSMDGQAGVEGMVGQALEYREEEKIDLLAAPDVEKLNSAYLDVHERPAVAHHLWVTTSEIL